MRKGFKFLSFWLFIALGTATVVFNSCGKDDDETQKEDGTEQKGSNPDDGKKDDGKKDNPDDGESKLPSDLNGIWLCTYAKTDCGGGDYDEYTESQGITWTFKTDGTVELRNANGNIRTESFSYKNGVITIIGLSYDVVSLTSSTLVLKLLNGSCAEDWTLKKITN